MKAKFNNKKILWFLFLIIYSLICLYLIYNIMKINKNHALRFHKLSPKRLESLEDLDKPLLDIINQQFFIEN